jgi:hypothetical protein
MRASEKSSSRRLGELRGMCASAEPFLCKMHEDPIALPDEHLGFRLLSEGSEG